ncbi:MAG: NADH-ubiquinone oxidoreductase-F iron-sulfur binding region domain-containing protein [Candidatus Woesearchaeota archaeon]
MRVRVGLGSAGVSSGALEVYKQFSQLGRDFILSKTGEMGASFLAPVVELKAGEYETLIFANVKPEQCERILSIGERLEKSGREVWERLVYAKRRDGTQIFKKKPYVEELDFFKGQVKNVSARCGIIDPESIEEYYNAGGFSALARALLMNQEDIIAEVKRSGLRGRGGSGFFTGEKWEAVFKQKSDIKYLICNFDEGDPGAFMNRALVESDPFSVLEGVIIAAYAVGASEAFIYTRSEYPLAISRLQNAIEEAQAAELLGRNILNSGFSLKLKLKTGAGAFVCGEETGLISSIEGGAGRPRPKPPYPSESGLFGMPTLINNVETLANIPLIINNGAEWFRQFGSESSPGTKMFSISGDAPRSGYVEVPLGIQLRRICEMAGLKESEVKAVQLGGPSGGLVSRAHLSINLDYEGVQQAEAIIGSGGVVFVGNNRKILETIQHGLKFLISESCGRCTPCREGIFRMNELVERIQRGEGTPQDVLNLYLLSNTIRDTSLCGLGKTAPNLVISSIRNFFAEYESLIREWKGKLQNVLSYTIDSKRCNGCHICATVCPKKAINGRALEIHEINQELCVKCGLCYKSCPYSAIFQNLAERDKNLKIEIDNSNENGL